MADFLQHALGISERVFYGNSVADWIAAGVVAVAVWAGLWILRRLIAARYTQYSTADKPTPIRVVFYLLGNTKQFLLLALALGAGREILTLPPTVERIVREQPNARFERCHLKSLGDSCLQFELSYFVQQPKFHSLFDLQQAVNFRILDEFRCLGVKFAYPTRRVLVEN